MTPQERALGRRAVACLPVEKWPTGSSFRCSHGENWIISSNTDDGCYVLSQHGDDYPYPSESTIPLVLEATALLGEPATLGALVFGLLPSLGIQLAQGRRDPTTCVGMWVRGQFFSMEGKPLPMAEAAVQALEGLS